MQTAQEPVGCLKGAIEFARVTFNYSTGRNTVLEDFVLTIPAGETLAIIIVRSEGQIIEEGNHDGLLAQGGHYAELYTTCFRHQSLDYQPWEAA